MKTAGVIWIKEIVEKLALKHRVEPEEVEQVLNSKPKIRFVEKAKERAKMSTQRLAGQKRARYLTVLFIYKLSREALILSARDMAKKARRIYGKK